MPKLVLVFVLCGLWCEAAGVGEILDRFTARLTSFNMSPQSSAALSGPDPESDTYYRERLVQYKLKDKATTSSMNDQKLVKFRISDDERAVSDKDRSLIEYSNEDVSVKLQDEEQEIVTEHLRNEVSNEEPKSTGVGEQSGATCVSEAVDDTTVVRAAVILPNSSDYVTSLASVLPVLRLAQQEVQRRQLLPAALAWQWLPRDDRCDAVHAQIGTFEAVKQNVHVFFGPVCEYSVAPVARMIKFWHTPLLTTGALTFDFSRDKRDPDSEYHLLLRAGLLSFRDMALFIIALLKMYEWEKVMLVYEKDGCRQISGKHTCKLMMETLVEFLKREGLHYGSYDLEKNAADGLSSNLRRELGYQYNNM